MQDEISCYGWWKELSIEIKIRNARRRARRAPRQKWLDAQFLCKVNNLNDSSSSIIKALQIIEAGDVKGALEPSSVAQLN